MSDMFKDVRAFHKKLGFMHQPEGGAPRKLSRRKLLELVQHLQEELDEFVEAASLKNGLQNLPQDFCGQADALVDLVYVALGVAVKMGLPWDVLWADVHRANMSKERGTTHRGFTVDAAKPVGWVGPHTVEILTEAGYNPDAPEVDDVN